MIKRFYINSKRLIILLKIDFFQSIFVIFIQIMRILSQNIHFQYFQNMKTIFRDYILINRDH